MRILLLQDTDWIRRNSIIQHYLAEKLAKRGHQIHVIDYEIGWRKGEKRGLFCRREEFRDFSKIYAGKGVTLIRPAIIKLAVLDYLSLLFGHGREIDRQMRVFSPEVIIGTSILSAYLGLRAAKKNRIPFLYFYIDVNHRLIPLRLFQPIGRFIESVLFKQADLVLTNSEKLKEYILSTAAVRQIKLVKSGIDLSRFDLDDDGSAVREQYALSHDDLVFLFVGRLYHFTGLPEVVTSLRTLKHQKVKLMIVGDGEGFRTIDSIRVAERLEGSVILAGQQPHSVVPAYIAAANVCIMPFEYNPVTRYIVPIKIYEYMAMGRPVIATRLPGVVAEFGFDNGVVYVDNPKDIAEEAIKIAAGEELAKLGTKARRFAENHDWDSITDEFEDVLQEAVRRKERTAFGQ